MQRPFYDIITAENRLHKCFFTLQTHYSVLIGDILKNDGVFFPYHFSSSSYLSEFVFLVNFKVQSFHLEKLGLFLIKSFCAFWLWCTHSPALVWIYQLIKTVMLVYNCLNTCLGADLWFYNVLYLITLRPVCFFWLKLLLLATTCFLSFLFYLPTYCPPWWHISSYGEANFCLASLLAFSKLSGNSLGCFENFQLDIVQHLC